MSNLKMIHFLKILLIGMLLFPVYAGHAKIESVKTVDWNFDGTKLAIGMTDGTVEIRDLTSGETTIYELPAPQTLTSLAWSPTDNRLAIASNYGVVHIFDAETEQMVRYLDAGDFVGAVMWRSDGTEIITVTQNGIHPFEENLVIEWDAVTGEALNYPGGMHPDMVSAIAMSPDGDHMAISAAGDGVAVWIRSEEGPPTNLGERVGEALALEWNPAGTKIATGNGDGELRVWSWPEVELLMTFRGEGNFVDMAWSPDGEQLTLVDLHHLYILDAITGQVLHSVQDSSILNSVAWNPAQDLIAYGGSSDFLQIVVPSDLSTPTPDD